MCGPFCSVPAVPMMTVVVPPLTRSRTSAHVSSSSKTVSGGLPPGAVAGAFAGRWAEPVDVSIRGNNRASAGRIASFFTTPPLTEAVILQDHAGIALT